MHTISITISTTGSSMLTFMPNKGEMEQFLTRQERLEVCYKRWSRLVSYHLGSYFAKLQRNNRIRMANSCILAWMERLCT